MTRIERRPSLEAISTSIRLHQQLVAFGLFTDKFSVLCTNDYNEAEPFDAGEVLMGSLDRVDLKIPIFTKFFRRSVTPKDCSICLESFHEIDVECDEEWKKACEGFHGSWMFEIFSFPTRNTLHCDHDTNFCKGCLARHLESQLDQHGRNARGRLTCPICNRVLSENEIRCLCSAETVQKYLYLPPFPPPPPCIQLTFWATDTTTTSYSRTSPPNPASGAAYEQAARTGKSMSKVNIPIHT